MNKTNQIAEGITNLNLLWQRMLSHSINTSFTKTLPQLKFLIQKENLKFHYPLPVLQRCSYYLSQKGVSLNALQQQLKDVKIRSNAMDEQRIQSNCYFYVKDFNIDNMNRLVGKAHEYDVFNNISTVMGDYEQLDIRSLYFDNKQSLKIGSTFRDEHKFKQYNAIVSQFITSNISGIEVSPIQLLKLFNKISKNQFWDLIVKIFDGVFFQDSEITIKQKMIDNSLKKLEQQFNQKLPTNDSLSLEMYIKGQFIDKLVYGRNYVHFDKNGRSIWAIVYTLLRAGRVIQIKQLLSNVGDKKFSSDFNSYLLNQNKQYKIGEEVKDVFLQAIYSIFNRKSQIAFQLISNQKDYLWFALKTVELNNKVADLDAFTFQQLQNQISQRFDNYSSRQNFINLILVQAFDRILKPNNFFDSDDTGHFMLFLYILRLDQSGFSDQNTREQFYQKMTSYSQQLIRTNMSTGLDYLILCYNKKSFPNSKVLSAISDLLIYTNTVQIFFGERPSIDTLLQDRVIKALLPTKQQYQNFIFQTMDSHSNRSKNYLYPAKVFEYVMNNTNRSIEYLLDILVKQITGQKIFQNSDLKEAIKLIESMKNPKYSRIFQFIQLTYYLKDVLKNNKQVDERVFSNKYFPNKIALSLQSQQILMDLSRADYLQVYAMFIFYSLKIIEKYYSFKTNKIREYMETLNYLKRHCKDLKSSGVFKESSITFKQKFSQIERQLQSIKL